MIITTISLKMTYACLKCSFENPLSFWNVLSKGHKDIFGPFKRTKRTLVTLSASQPRAQGSGHWETNWGSWELSCVANRSTRGTPKLRKSSQRNQGLRTILCWWDQPSKPCWLGPSISSSDALDTERCPWIGQREAGPLTDPKETRKPANPLSWCKPELSERILMQWPFNWSWNLMRDKCTAFSSFQYIDIPTHPRGQRLLTEWGSKTSM